MPNTPKLSEEQILDLCTCGKFEYEVSPAMHAGCCPVWAAHHGLITVTADEH
jgi:hypothetical protein